MSAMTKGRTEQERLLDYTKQIGDLEAELAGIGCIWQGSITVRRMTCGNKTCECHRDPERRHGPYSYWSTKLRGKTVSRLLSDAEVELYAEWIENRKRFDAIRKEIMAVSQKMAPLILKAREQAATG